MLARITDTPHRKEQRRTGHYGLLVAMLAAALTGATLLGLFFQPIITTVIASVAILTGVASWTAYRLMRRQAAQISIRAGHVRLRITLENSPFDDVATNALIDGAADYLTRGLRTGVLPELKMHTGASTYLASPTSLPSINGHADHVRLEARSLQAATPAETTTSPAAYPAAARPPKESSERQATAEQTIAQALMPVATPPAKPQLKPAAPAADYAQLMDDYAHDEEEGLALSQAASHCEICLVMPPTGTTAVFDGDQALKVAACDSCVQANAAHRRGHGYPMLFKRGSHGLVTHTRAPVTAAATSDGS